MKRGISRLVARPTCGRADGNCDRARKRIGRSSWTGDRRRCPNALSPATYRNIFYPRMRCRRPNAARRRRARATTRSLRDDSTGGAPSRGGMYEGSHRRLPEVRSGRRVVRLTVIRPPVEKSKSPRKKSIVRLPRNVVSWNRTTPCDR